jgi:hypothetical protein
MSSYLTFTSPTITEPNVRPLAGFEPDEFQYMALALVQRLREGSMPPDDAYWWARALCAEPYMQAFRTSAMSSPIGRPSNHSARSRELRLAIVD